MWTNKMKYKIKKKKLKEIYASNNINLIRSVLNKKGNLDFLYSYTNDGFEFLKNKTYFAKLAKRVLTLDEASEVLETASSLINNGMKKKAGVLDVLKVVIDLVTPYTWLFLKDARLNTAFKMLKEYVTEQSRTASLSKKAINTIWPPTDTSLPTLEILLNEGYDTVEWEASPTTIDAECLSLDGQKWPLEEFINNTSYGAPIFSKSHVGCKCTISVTGPGLPDKKIMAY